MGHSTKAIFLSYASQDADAAKRICEALRQAGIEVWFDTEGGLEHGDAWDAKIRRQIRDCVLFIPIISANTEAREEGYFRIEWELAAQRALGVAEGVAFILPVVIDDTREQHALVPERFRAVQWTRLPLRTAHGGPATEIPPEVVRRFHKLWSVRTEVLQRGADQWNVASASAPAGKGSLELGIPWRKHVGLALGLVAVVGLGAGWLLRETATPPSTATGAAVRPAAIGAQPEANFPRGNELARAVDLVETINSTREDHRLAEDLAMGVLARDPTDPEAVIVSAYVQNRFILRGFDLSRERYAEARRLSQRALALAPDHPEALFVMGMHLVFQQADPARAVELVGRAISLRPNRPRYYDSYLDALTSTDPTEAVRQAEAAVARFPNDALLRYRQALVYSWAAGDLERHEQAIDETLAIAPVATATLRKAVLQLLIHRDPAAAKRSLDAVPGEFRLSDRTVFHRYTVAYASGDTAEAVRALETLPGAFISDFGKWPKRLLIGDLWRREGNEVLARQEYEAALDDIAREGDRMADEGLGAIPSQFGRSAGGRLDLAEAWLLLRLGRQQEARAKAELIFATATRPHRLRAVTNHGFGVISLLLLLDQRARALELLRETEHWARRMLAGTIATNPDLARWRDDAEIQALLREPVQPGTSAGVAPRVVETNGAVPAVADHVAD